MWPLILNQTRYCYLNRLFSTSSAANIKKSFPSWPEGLEYHGFKYYPRPGEVDPVITPSKLFMVQRIQSLKGQPHWIKKIIEEFDLHKDEVNKVVVKNTPEVNKKLWVVKHIIKITPITYPYGEPQEGDQGYLNDKGQYLLTQKIGAEVDEARLQASHQFFKDPRRMDADTMKSKLRDKWLTSRK
uniref:Large ribosomal subunit protein uL30m n=1 Tax=Graphocephala atropunctata TaxID=36148 RepID=A0A1B6LYN7_9HEMI